MFYDHRADILTINSWISSADKRFNPDPSNEIINGLERLETSLEVLKKYNTSMMVLVQYRWHNELKLAEMSLSDELTPYYYLNANGWAEYQCKVRYKNMNFRYISDNPDTVATHTLGTHSFIWLDVHRTNLPDKALNSEYDWIEPGQIVLCSANDRITFGKVKHIIPVDVSYFIEIEEIKDFKKLTGNNVCVNINTCKTVPQEFIDFMLLNKLSE